MKMSNKILSTATKQAKCLEYDRIKIFLACLKPSSINGKIKEYYGRNIQFFLKKRASRMERTQWEFTGNCQTREL